MKTDSAYILMLEDDADDRHITTTFFAEGKYDIGIEFLTNPDEVLPYLENCMKTGRKLPGLILLDKNTPVGSSMEVLKQIKSHPLFCAIPVVMISGMAYPADVYECYRLGVNSFITKPLYHQDTQNVIGGFVKYWFDTVELPDVSFTTVATL